VPERANFVLSEEKERDMADNVKEIPVVWYQAASCSGDSVALLNSASPYVRNVLVDEIVPGAHVNLLFQMTVMAGQGQPVVDILQTSATDLDGAYLLIVEGTIPTAADGLMGFAGEKDGKPYTMVRAVEELGRGARAAIAVGTCASYGGIFAAEPNPTGSMGLGDFFTSRNVPTSVINIPGCPMHPDWLVGTIARILLFGLPGPQDLDEAGRPIEFFAANIHENCPRRPFFDAGKFAKKLGDEGCLYNLGCKGPVAHADCWLRGFNNHTNWCIQAGSPCHGCTEPEFPDTLSPLYQKLNEERLARLMLPEGAAE
jgi:hydrogenase small subunit